MSCNPCLANVCADKFGCPPDACPDFIIKRHDTKPAFEVSVKDCADPIDLTDLVLEVNMWAKGKLKKAITKDDTFFALADNIGFCQALIGDVIVMDAIRAPEQMLVTGFDEKNKFIQVQRGYHGSIISEYSKGTSLKIFRVLNAIGETESVFEDQIQVDGTKKCDVLTDSKLVYEWQAEDTCLPGCYWLEFKLLKMESVSVSVASVTPSIVPSFITSYTASQIGCDIGSGVEWVRRFPIDVEGFLIKIVDSPMEM